MNWDLDLPLHEIVFPRSLVCLPNGVALPLMQVNVPRACSSQEWGR